MIESWAVSALLIAAAGSGLAAAAGLLPRFDGSGGASAVRRSASLLGVGVMCLVAAGVVGLSKWG